MRCFSIERLPLKDLGEEVRGVLIGRDVLHLNDAGTPHLAQLEELAIDVAGVLRRRVLVAQLPRPLVVGLDHYVALALVADELQEGDNVNHLDSELRERHELGLSGRHGDAALSLALVSDHGVGQEDAEARCGAR